MVSHPAGCSVTYEETFLDQSDVERLSAELEAHSDHFDGTPMLVGEEWRTITRRVLGFGDRPFSFPDMATSLAWPQLLKEIRDRLARRAGHPFNYALVNWYPDGTAQTGWHADKMALHNSGSGIAIVSLGATRTLAFRSAIEPAARISQNLASGSLVWMRGETQAYYEHCIPAQPEVTQSRMSITFRWLLDSVGMG